MVGVRPVAALVLVAMCGGYVAAAVEAEVPPGPPQLRVDEATSETLRRGDAYSHLIAAGLAVSRGRAAEATREVERAVELEPASAELHAQGASLLAMLGRRADAERMARRALELDAGELEAVRVLADLAASRSFGPRADPTARAEAIRSYQRLSVEDPSPPDEIWSALARLKLLDGDAAGAVDAAGKLLARRPGDQNALRLLAQALVTAGRTQEALDLVLGWLKAHPDADDLLPLVVEMARETGNWALIESTCNDLLAADPDHTRARALRGEARLRQGHPEAALEDLELARAATPRDPMVRLHVAAAYQALNRLADATQVAQSLSAEYPDNTFVRILLAETLARRGESHAAREEYAAALRGVLGDSHDDQERRDEIRLRMVGLDLAAERNADAKALLDALESSDAPDALMVRARAALILGEPKEARRLARLLAPAEPGSAALIEGEAELKLGRPAKATERFRSAVAKDGPPTEGDVAAILRRNGLDSEAEARLRAWAAAAPEDAEARLALGALLDRSGRFDQAEAELREAIRLDPASADALNYLGYSLADRGVRLDEAVDLIRKALVIDPWNGAFLDSLGWAYYKQGSLEAAREPLERAVREFPRDATVLDHLGDFYRSTGDSERARAYWRRALDAGPESEDAKRAIEKKLLDASTPVAPPPGNEAALTSPGP